MQYFELEMFSPMRICFPTGMESKIEFKNGKVQVDGPSAKTLVKWVDLGLTIANASEIVGVEKDEDCVQRFLENRSDFSVSFYSIHDESGRFSVPVPCFVTSIYILSGYDVRHYIEEQEKQKKSFDILENFTSFSGVYYILAALWMLTLILTILARVLMIRRRPRLFRGLKRSVDCIFSMASNLDEARKWMLVSFTLQIGLFLLLTPFSVYFKTNQVVLEEPSVVSSYEEIMDEKVKIRYSRMGIDITNYLERASDTPQGERDVIKRMKKYFLSNSKDLKLTATPETLITFGELAKSVINNSYVFLGSDAIIEALRQVLCSWSSEPNLYQMVKFHDPHQQEILVGFTFRMSQLPKKLVKKLLYAFEGHIPATLLTMMDNYMGFGMVSNSQAHRHRQLFVCQQQNVIRHRRDEIHVSDMNFFHHFFELFICILLFAFTLVCLETVTPGKRSKERKKRTKKRDISRQICKRNLY